MTILQLPLWTATPYHLNNLKNNFHQNTPKENIFSVKIFEHFKEHKMANSRVQKTKIFVQKKFLFGEKKNLTSKPRLNPSKKTYPTGGNFHETQKKEKNHLFPPT